MARTLDKTVERLRRVVGKTALAGQTDRQLLERFARAGDETAFGELVQRHGSLVLGVCRRVLGHMQDAEDAFQATFLVLARKAGQVSWDDSIKNWLHGVAYRVALKARAQGLKRKHKEKAVVPPSSHLEGSWEEMRSVLDEELARMPDKYRTPLLLCYLEGKTRDEAAEELGWTTGSVKGRLERGRELLRARLLQRGLPLASVLCASLLSETAATAAVPLPLAAAAVHAGVSFAAGATAAASTTAIQLAQGVLYAMLITKIKTSMFGGIILAVLGLGSGLLLQEANAERTPALLIVAPAQAVLQFAQEKEGGVRPKDGDNKKEGRPKDGDNKKEGRPKEGEGKKDGEVRKGPREIPGEIRGFLKSLNLEKGTLTVQMTGERNTGEHTYSLASKDVKVSVLPTGQPAKLADLVPKTMVYLQVNDLDDVVAIRAQGLTVGGALSKVDAAKSEITLTEGRETPAKTIKVAGDAHLFLNGREAKLDQFAAGARVNLTMSLDGATVLAMNSGDPKRDAPREAPREGARDGDGPRRTDASGVVIAVHPEKNVVEVLVGTEDDFTLRTLEVSKDLAIQVRLDRNFKEISLKELPKTAKVLLTLSPDKKTVTRLEVLAPQVKTAVQAIDPAKRKITYNDKTLDVAEDARIVINRKEVPLTEINEGMRVLLVLNLERTHVIAIQAFRADGERE